MILLIPGGAPLSPHRVVSIPIPYEPRRPRPTRTSAGAARLLDGANLHDLRDIVLQHVLDAHPQGRRRARTAGAGDLEMDVDDAALEAAKDDVAPILGHRRTHARIEQLLDLRNDLVVLS